MKGARPIICPPEVDAHQGGYLINQDHPLNPKHPKDKEIIEILQRIANKKNAKFFRFNE